MTDEGRRLAREAWEAVAGAPARPAYGEMPLSEAQLGAARAYGRGVRHWGETELTAAAEARYGRKLTQLTRREAFDFISWVRGGGA